jgi:low affinity Fe/Cu permease
MSFLAGHPLMFGSAVGLVILWAASGPFFHYSNTWQLAINTSTTVVTFLMVFLIQHNQNRDSAAIQVKLNEIIRVMEGAENKLLNAEDKTIEELEELKKTYVEAAMKAQEDVQETHAQQREARSAID